MRACDYCGAVGFIIQRDFNAPTRRWLEGWQDSRTCDGCAEGLARHHEELQKAEVKARMARNLRWQRRTHRRTKCKRDGCGTEFWFQRGGTWPTYCKTCAALNKVCPECGTAFWATHPKEMECGEHCEAQRVAKAWWSKLPGAYRATKPSLLPAPDCTRLVMDWEADPLPGLFVHGATGTGKTRSLLLRTRAWIHDGFDDVYFLRSSEFATGVIERCRPGGIGGLAGWMADLKAADVVALDELEKLKLSERVGVEFFELIESRLHSLKVTMLAGNFSPEATAKKLGMASEYAAPWLRRIYEFCEVIEFKNPTKKAKS